MKEWSELPVEIQEKMLEHQFTQTGKRDASVFEEMIDANTWDSGIDWSRTPEPEAFNFWYEVIDGNFDLFYERYPKKKDKRFPLIAKHNIEGDIVCFTDETKGITLSSEYSERGCYSEWSSCTNKECWTIIAQPSEYPKEMYVSNACENRDFILSESRKRVVFAEKNGGFYTWADARTIEESGKSRDVIIWKYAVEIPEEEPKDELKKELEELKTKVKEFEEKLQK